MTTLRQRVFQHVVEHPGLTSTDVGVRLNENRTSVSDALGTLCADGLLARYKDGRFFRYVDVKAVELWASADVKPDTRVVAELREANARLHKYLDEAQAQVVALVAEEADLTAQVQTLEAWRDMALGKYPDLAPVDPLLRKAREIAATIAGDRGAGSALIHDILTGQKDGSGAVQVALAALRSLQA